MKRLLQFFVVLSAVLLLSSCGKKPEAPAAPPPGVLCALSVKEDVMDTMEYIGQIVAEDWVDLVARLEGYLVKRNFEEGSFVKQNDLVFEIDPLPFEASVKEAEGQLVNVQATLTNANIEFNRYSTLVQCDAAAQKDLDNATMTLGQAKGNLLVAQGQLDIARINLGYTKIPAPFDGKIGVCPISVCNLVAPTINNNLTRIVRMNPVKIEFSVPETKIISLIEHGLSMENAATNISCRITLANGTDYPEEGTIYFYDNEVSTSTGTLIIRARFQNPKGMLSPGEYVKVRLGKKVKAAAILVPAIAIQRDQAGEYVFTVDKDSKVQRKPVKTGQQHGLNVVILEGLSEGERVIVQGVLKVRPGVTANVSMEETKMSVLKTPAGQGQKEQEPATPGEKAPDAR